MTDNLAYLHVVLYSSGFTKRAADAVVSTMARHDIDDLDALMRFSLRTGSSRDAIVLSVITWALHRGLSITEEEADAKYAMLVAKKRSRQRQQAETIKQEQANSPQTPAALQQRLTADMLKQIEFAQVLDTYQQVMARHAPSPERSDQPDPSPDATLTRAVLEAQNSIINLQSAALTAAQNVFHHILQSKEVSP